MARKEKKFDQLDTFPSRFRDLIKDKCENEGFTREKIADELGITYNTLNNYCSGYSAPDVTILCKIMDMFNVSSDWLLKKHAPQKVDVNLSAVCEYTALSEDAAKVLRFLAKEQDTRCISVINRLICEDEGGLIDSIVSFQAASRAEKIHAKGGETALVEAIEDEGLDYETRAECRYLLMLKRGVANGLAGKDDFSITTDEFPIWNYKETYRAKSFAALNRILDSITQGEDKQNG